MHNRFYANFHTFEEAMLRDIGFFHMSKVLHKQFYIFESLQKFENIVLKFHHVFITKCGINQAMNDI